MHWLHNSGTVRLSKHRLLLNRNPHDNQLWPSNFWGTPGQLWSIHCWGWRLLHEDNQAFLNATYERALSTLMWCTILSLCSVECKSIVSQVESGVKWGSLYWVGQICEAISCLHQVWMWALFLAQSSLGIPIPFLRTKRFAWKKASPTKSLS